MMVHVAPSGVMWADVIGGCTLLSCTTGSTIRFGAAVWVMITGDGSGV